MVFGGCARPESCPMKIRSFLCLVIFSILGACSKPDPSVILGNWRADSFRFDGLKLPIAPNLEVTQNELILRSRSGVPIQKLPLAAIRADDQTIELEFQNGFGVGVEFVVDSKDQIRFKVPLRKLCITPNHLCKKSDETIKYIA